MFHSRSLSKEILVSLEDVTCPVEPRAQESNRQNEPTLMGDGWHQSVFAKTDTRRQAELVRLIAESISAELIDIGSRSVYARSPSPDGSAPRQNIGFLHAR
jgi:hypothetical protein